MNTSGQLYADLHYFPEEKAPQSQIKLPLIWMKLLKRKMKTACLKCFGHLIQDCKWKYFHRKYFQDHLLAFGIVAGHSTPCGTLYHRNRKKACYPGGAGMRGGEKEKKILNTALLRFARQLFAFGHANYKATISKEKSSSTEQV